ncbi:hypothetical protein SUGI_0483140 [Cryptomeria japonica]|nr:hypothetical protein SUGI_0483140 [Cryptomeria japonica]
MGLGIWLVLLLLPIISCSACSEDERMSLLDFKKGLNFNFYREYGYAPLESWRGLNCCAWEGVGCHPRTAHVLSLDLHFFEWSEIRGGLFQLLHLEHLDLSYNYFDHPLSIPPQVGELRRLKYLSLSECGFTGQIPREIGNMSTLKFLDLSRNDGLQSSKLGDWITNLRGLEYLDLSYNNLTMAGDTLLGSIARLTNLTKIYIFSCGLSGEIPPSFANLSRLQSLELSGNSLRGNIPAFGGPLPLWILDLSGNNLEGSLPSSLGGLSKLQYLYLDSNKLNGSIPSILGNLSALSVLVLQNNSLSGPIPTSFAKLSKLEFVDMAKNRNGNRLCD